MGTHNRTICAYDGGQTQIAGGVTASGSSPAAVVTTQPWSTGATLKRGIVSNVDGGVTYFYALNTAGTDDGTSIAGPTPTGLTVGTNSPQIYTLLGVTIPGTLELYNTGTNPVLIEQGIPTASSFSLPAGSYLVDPLLDVSTVQILQSGGATNVSWRVLVGAP